MKGVERRFVNRSPAPGPDQLSLGDIFLCTWCGSEYWTVGETIDTCHLLLQCAECGEMVSCEKVPTSNENKPDSTTYRVGARGLYGGGD
jgi:hypothetical protein